MKNAILFVAVLATFEVFGAVELSAQQFSAGQNQILYNPNARVVRARMGIFGNVRFAQRGYLSSRFFDSVDRNSPLFFDFISDLVPVFFGTETQTLTSLNGNMGAFPKTNAALAALRAENNRTETLINSLNISLGTQGTSSGTLSTAAASQGRHFILSDGSTTTLPPIELKENETLIRSQIDTKGQMMDHLSK